MITIMTPTYNRAYILHKAYRSLKKQTSFDFEWIIIDDGSSDNTEELANQWMRECTDFDIIYYKQSNGGKHRAINRAVQMARYEWFLILDSDDELTENAVESIHVWIADVSGCGDIVGVAGLRGTSDHVIGERLKREYIDATNLERKKYGLLGDKAEIYKTKILKQYPFPEFEGENFLRESAVWDRIAKDGLKLRWYNDIVYLCEYIEDGLTKNTNTETYKRNFNGFTYCSKLFIETHSWLLSLHKCGEFYNVAKERGITMRMAAQTLDVGIIPFMTGVLLFNLKQWIKVWYKKINLVIRRRKI